jgi:hypothetical protein
MKPIYMSANYEQVDIIKALLTEAGVDTKLIAKEDANNPLAPKGIIWFELWLKRQSDTETAETAIEKHEFGQLKASLKVTWDALHAPVAKVDSHRSEKSVEITSPQNNEPAEGAYTAKNGKFSITSNVSKEKRDALMRAAYENWLPVNNQKVFQRLASTLGFSDDEISTGQFNNIRRPWNADRLKNQVKALQQLCKVKSVQPTAAMANTEIDNSVN